MKKKRKKNKARRSIPVYNPVKTDSPKSSYQIFLKSKYWAYVRRKVLIRDKKTCVSCGRKSPLQVHHLTYKHHGMEHRFLKDLITVCKACHDAIHEIQERNEMLGLK